MTDGRVRAANARRAATRQQIIDVALEEWRRLDDVAEQRGEWPSVGMQTIARHAGVAVSTLYDHFSSQGVLAASVMRSALEEDAFGWVASAGADGHPLERLRELIGRLATVMLAHRALTSTVITTASMHAIRHGAPSGEPEDPRTALPLPMLIGELVARGQAHGALRADLDAVEVGSSLNNLLMLRVMTRPESHPDDIAEHVLGLVVEGLRRR